MDNLIEYSYDNNSLKLFKTFDEVIEFNYRDKTVKFLYSISNSVDLEKLYNMDEIVKQMCFNMIDEAYSNGVFEFITNRYKTMSIGEVGTIEYRMKIKGSGPIWCVTKLIRINDYICLCCSDNVSKIFTTKYLERENESLRQQTIQNERYQILINNTGTLLFEWDYINKEFFCNKGYKDFLISEMFSTEYSENDDLERYVHKEDVDTLEKYRRKTALFENAEATLRLKKTDGSMTWCRLNSTFIRENNKIIRVIGTITDVDKTVAMEKKIEEDTKKKLKQYKQKLDTLEPLSDTVIGNCKVNITQNYLYESTSLSKYAVCPNLHDIPYDKYVLEIIDNIKDMEEYQNAYSTFEREHILELYSKGITEIEADYRRFYNEDNFLWVKSHIKLVEDPENGDVIGLGYTVDIDKNRRELTTSKRLINQLYEIVKKQYYFVMSLDYDNYSYDIVSCTKRYRREIPTTGNISDFSRVARTFYSEESQNFLFTLMSEALLKTKIDLDTNSWEFEGQIENQGINTWYRHTIFALTDDKTNKTIYLYTTMDIDEAKKKAITVQNQVDIYKRLSKEKDEFLLRIAQEIRTPLVRIRDSINAYNPMVNKDDDSKLLNASSEARLLINIVDSIGDMVRINKNTISAKNLPVSCDGLLAEVSSIMGSVASQKGINYSSSKGEIAFNSIYSDSDILKHILVILLTNAIMYTCYGGNISLSVSSSVISGNKIKVKFVIEDNGIGMSQDMLDALYSPKEDANGDFMSYGMGFGVVNDFVKLIDGKLDATSQKGIGTKVMLSIDAEGFNDEKIAHNISKTEDDFQGKHVLLVDRNELTIMMAKIQLESLGIEVDMIRDGIEAVNMFKNSKVGYYDAIFMDLLLPKLDGIDATNKIRGYKRRDASEIIICAITDDEDILNTDRYRTCKFDGLIKKPFEKKHMVEILRKIL